MATYIANKPCRFGGEYYLIGEKIPSNKILPRRVGGLLRTGVIIEGKDSVTGLTKQPATESVEQSTEENSKKTKK